MRPPTRPPPVPRRGHALRVAEHHEDGFAAPPSVVRRALRPRPRPQRRRPRITRAPQAARLPTVPRTRAPPASWSALSPRTSQFRPPLVRRRAGGAYFAATGRCSPCGNRALRARRARRAGEPGRVEMSRTGEGTGEGTGRLGPASRRRLLAGLAGAGGAALAAGCGVPGGEPAGGGAPSRGRGGQRRLYGLGGHRADAHPGRPRPAHPGHLRGQGGVDPHRGRGDRVLRQAAVHGGLGHRARTCSSSPPPTSWSSCRPTAWRPSPR